MLKLYNKVYIIESKNILSFVVFLGEWKNFTVHGKRICKSGL